MRNNKSSRWFLNKKGYATVLFSCALVAAILIGLNSATNSDKKAKPEGGNKNNVQIEEVKDVSINKNAPPKSYSLHEDVLEKETSDYVYSKKPPVKVEEPKIKKEEPVETKKQESNKEGSSKSQDTDETQQSENDVTLQWPLGGKIVLDYSTDKAIYDVTLEQYRTNDSVSIGAELGTSVKAAESGIVEFVGADDENGNTVIINHNNGWKTTYSQLQDGIKVSEGEAVDVGQVIGSVGKPTMYGIALGNHLDFKVTRDEQAIDPKLVLAQ